MRDSFSASIRVLAVLAAAGLFAACDNRPETTAADAGSDPASDTSPTLPESDLGMTDSSPDGGVAVSPSGPSPVVQTGDQGVTWEDRDSATSASTPGGALTGQTGANADVGSSTGMTGGSSVDSLADDGSLGSPDMSQAGTEDTLNDNFGNTPGAEQAMAQDQPGGSMDEQGLTSPDMGEESAEPLAGAPGAEETPFFDQARGDSQADSSIIASQPQPAPDTEVTAEDLAAQDQPMDEDLENSDEPQDEWADESDQADAARQGSVGSEGDN